MSWKSLVSAGLLCVVASPVFAVPSLQVSNGGLDASGNWIWNVTITPTATATPLAAELGFRETTAGSQLLTAIKNAAIWDTDNPGSDIFGTNASGDWEVHTDVDDGAGVNMKPVGVQTNAATDEVFSALGSIDLTSASAVQYMTITTAGPVDTRLGTSLQVLGGYSGNGRIAEITGANATNYSNFAGTASRTVVVGDMNLSGTAGGGAAVTIADFSTMLQSLNKALGPRGWQHGDLNGTTGGTEVTIADFSLLLTCLNKTTPACSGSANTSINQTGVAGGGGASLGGGGASVVPEPASVALAGLALLSGLGMTMRRRQK